jgi:hypothetical protein
MAISQCRNEWQHTTQPGHSLAPRTAGAVRRADHAVGVNPVHQLSVSTLVLPIAERKMGLCYRRDTGRREVFVHEMLCGGPQTCAGQGWSGGREAQSIAFFSTPGIE